VYVQTNNKMTLDCSQSLSQNTDH